MSHLNKIFLYFEMVEYSTGEEATESCDHIKKLKERDGENKDNLIEVVNI